MASKLIIRFTQTSLEDETIDWLTVQSHKIKTGKSLLNEMPVITEPCLVVVLIPTIFVLCTHIKLPRMPISKLRKVVPFAVEEYLSVDLSDVHIAILQTYLDGNLPVCMVSHDYIKTCLEKLKEAGIKPDVMLPDSWYFPYEEGVWTVWVEEKLARNSAWVKIDKYQTFSSDLENLPILINLKLTEWTHENKPLPKQIVVIFSEHLQESVVEMIQTQINVPIPVNAHLAEKNLLEILVENIPEKQTFNLLQPPYEVKQKWGKLKKYWIAVALLLIIWLGLFLFKTIFEYVYLKQQNKQLEKQALSLYQEIFHSSSNNNPQLKTQLQQRLSRTIQVAKGEPFLKQLSQVAPLIKQSHIVLIGFNYENQKLTLKLEAQNFQALNELLQLFKRKGIMVEQKNTGQQGSQIISEWVIS